MHFKQQDPVEIAAQNQNVKVVTTDDPIFVASVKRLCHSPNSKLLQTGNVMITSLPQFCSLHLCDLSLKPFRIKMLTINELHLNNPRFCTHII